MTDDTTAQVLRLSHLLGCGPDEISFLQRFDADDLREFHSLLTEVFFDPRNAGLGALSGMARLLPPQVTAKVAEKALGPVLCGRIAGSLDPGLAAAITKRLPRRFLADVAGHVHPGRVESIVSRLPASQVHNAAMVLVERTDLIALGAFSNIVDQTTLSRIIGSLDSATLLDIAPFIEPLERTSFLIDMVDDPALTAVLRHAHTDSRWVDAFDLVRRLDVPVRTRIATLTVPDTELIDGALRAAAEHDRFNSLLAFTIHASSVPPEHWNEIDGFRDSDVITAALDSAQRHGLWNELRMLTAMWPQDLRATLAGMVDEHSRGLLGV